MLTGAGLSTESGTVFLGYQRGRVSTFYHNYPHYYIELKFRNSCFLYNALIHVIIIFVDNLAISGIFLLCTSPLCTVNSDDMSVNPVHPTRYPGLQE